MSTTTLQNAAEEDEEIPCTPGRKVVKKMASLLVKPNVSFVSLVGHAANGLAFGIVKDEDGQATVIQPTTSDPMPKDIPTFGSAGASLNRLEFDLNVFKNETDVQKYLTESNITASRILKTDTHYIVPGIHEDSLENVEAVKGDKDGVTYFIGKLKAPVAAKITPPTPKSKEGKAVALKKGEGEAQARLRGDDDEGEENEFERVFKSEKAAELDVVVQKMDTYIARQIKTTDVDATLATGNPEIPGLWEIMSAVRVTVENIVTTAEPADFSAKIQAAFSRGGQIAAALAGIFVTVKKSDEGDVTEVSRDIVKQYFSSPEPKSAKAGEGEGVVKKSEDEPAPAPAAAPAPDLTAMEVVLKKHLEPVTKQMAELSGTVEEVKKSVEDRTASIESRVVEIEQVRQVRKSLPDDGDTPVAKSEKEKAEEVRKAEKTQREEAERKKDEEFARRQSRSRLGLIGS